MNTAELRYIVEHRFLPSNLFQTPEQVIGTITTKKNEFIWKLFDIIATQEQIKNPFSQDDFQVHLFKVNEELFMIQIEMPEPEREPECRRIYIVFQKDFSKIHYFTIESGNMDTSDFLCGWDKDSHLNYGKAPEDRKEEIDKIIELANG